MVYIKINYLDLRKDKESTDLFIDCEENELTDELVKERAIRFGAFIPSLGEEYVGFSVLATGNKAVKAWKAYEAYRQAYIKMQNAGFVFDGHGGYTYKG